MSDGLLNKNVLIILLSAKTCHKTKNNINNTICVINIFIFASQENVFLIQKTDMEEIIMRKITLKDIENARETIEGIVKKTDLNRSMKLSDSTKANVFLKCENLQKTGSFKVRGACNKIANRSNYSNACYCSKS